MDWLKIQHAVTIAKTWGYEVIEVPWIVPVVVGHITRPANACPIHTTSPRYPTGLFEGELVASGEQGLLGIWSKLKENAKYVTTTPCFRTEERYIQGHTEPWFMKTELMWVMPADSVVAMNHVVKCAGAIMGTWTRKLRHVPTADGTDLYLGDVEVGSYGVRRHREMKWVYGTGIAEPRFTYALDKGP